MTLANFPEALRHEFVYEGGYVNHPRDPGGPTMKGVTQVVYDGYRDRAGVARRTVRQISDAELQAIYRRQFWDAIRGDELPAGVDFVVFDAAVNSGVSRAIKWLQKALGAKVDGHLGEATVAAVKNHPDHDALISEICAIRLAFMKVAKGKDGKLLWPTFGKGWAIRVKSVDDIGRGMTASEHVAVSIENTEASDTDTSGKCDAPPASEQKTGITETTAVTSGGVLATILYYIQQAPSSIVETLLAKPELLLLVVVAGGLTYIGYRRFVQKRTVDA